MNKSLIYRAEEGKEIQIDDTLNNRLLARLRGFKLVRKVFYGVDWGKSQDDK